VTLTLLPLFSLLTGCTPEPADAPRPAPELHIEQYDGSNALNEVSSFIAISPRVAGTEGMKSAAEYIEGRLSDIGLSPEITLFHNDTPAGRIALRNVSARLPGKRDDLLILLSHTDTKAGVSPDFTGANDSGSSTGLLIALAEHLKRNSAALDYSILFAFVDGEECRYRYGPRDGLHGSRHLAGSIAASTEKRRILGVIVVDMIGDRDLNIEIPPNGSAHLTAAILDAARKQKATRYFSRGRNSILDDHQPFIEAGIPAIDIIDFAYGAAPGRNNYWHTPEDSIDKLSAESLRITGRTILQFLADLNPR